MRNLLKIALSCTTLSLIATPVFSEAPTDQGLTIATEADNRDNGFGDFTANLKMTLRNKQGEESIRNMRSKTLEVDGDGDKSLTIFDRPEDVKGTALLTFTHKVGSDDQWLYLPALKRVKRIASNNKSGPFMGSEFAYEDISSQEVEKYTYKFVKEEQVDGEDMLVIERYPVDKKSGYTKQVVWFDKSEYRERKIDYYDRKKALLKTMILTDYQKYIDKIWRASTMKMNNHQTGKSTTLSWSNFKFSTGLSKRDFDRNSLKRAQ
ncbi:MAG: outer membrane lipoprotein-sorting protein [Gammaproteobacteria bacterium]